MGKKILGRSKKKNKGFFKLSNEKGYVDKRK